MKAELNSRLLQRRNCKSRLKIAANPEALRNVTAWDAAPRGCPRRRYCMRVVQANHAMKRTIAALALLALATSTANLPLAVALAAGGLALGATVPAD